MFTGIEKSHQPSIGPPSEDCHNYHNEYRGLLPGQHRNAVLINDHLTTAVGPIPDANDVTVGIHQH